MRNRKDIQADMASIYQAHTNLLAELDQLKTRETELLRQAGEDILAGGDSASMQALSEVRTRREAVTQAASLARIRLRRAEGELGDVTTAERQQQWDEQEQEIRRLLALMEKAIGEDGLKGQVDTFIDLVRKSREFCPNQDAFILVDKSEFLWVEISRDLYAAWQQLEGFNQRLHFHDPRPESGNGRIPGFGKLP
jgi:hypothetical protein